MRLITFLWLLLMMLMPVSVSAKTFKGTINIEVGETYTVSHGYGSGYTVSGYWEKTDGNAFRITSSSSGNGGCTIVGNQVGTSTLNWWGVVSAGWDVWESEYYWTVNVSAAPVYITINSTNFPDDIFRQYLLNEYYGKDGKLSETEINDIRGLSIDNKGIENLKGIEYFTELKELSCSRNKLQSLNLSKNTKLTHLSCFGNQLTSLNISNCTELEWLQCPSNKLTSLDVSKCSKLNWFDCSNNELSSLDLSKNIALETLDCNQNHSMTTLNVSGCEALKSINCWYNNISSLDLTKTTSLTELKCGKNQLSSLDLTANTALTSVYCSENQLTDLNVSKNVALTSLDCGYNSELTTIDVSKNTNLEQLNVWATKLTELDVTKNTKLTKLVCSKSTITSLNLTKNTLLTYLSWEDGLLESLNLSNNTALTLLRCRNNKITSLDLTNCTQLETLWCDHNQLTSLILPNSSKLTTFWIDHNRIAGNAMDKLINSLPTNTTNETYTFRALFSGKNGWSDNVCTTKQVAAAKAKGWNPLYYNGGWVEYNGGYDFVIIAKDYSREYGDADPEFEYEIYGGEITGTPELSHFSKYQDVGTWGIIVNQGTVQGSVALVNGILTINKAPLTVSVENCTKKEGEPNPDFILHYAGWKNEQDESVLTAKPTATTTATTSSPVGTYEIVVTGGEAKNYAFNYVNGTLTIGKNQIKPSGIVLPAEATVMAGQTITLTPEITPADAETTLTWASDDETIATVDADGMVTGVKKGLTFITVTTDNGLEAFCELTVTEPVAPKPTKITIPDKLSVSVGQKVKIDYTLVPENAETTVTWTISKEIATIDADGFITGKTEGLAVIKATTANGVESNSCRLTVTPAPEIKGDVNGDGVVDVADISSIISVMAGQGGNITEKSADVNGDGTVDVADISSVITRMAELARMHKAFVGE